MILSGSIWTGKLKFTGGNMKLIEYYNALKQCNFHDRVSIYITGDIELNWENYVFLNEPSKFLHDMEVRSSYIGEYSELVILVDDD